MRTSRDSNDDKVDAAARMYWHGHRTCMNMLAHIVGVDRASSFSYSSRGSEEESRHLITACSIPPVVVYFKQVLYSVTR